MAITDKGDTVKVYDRFELAYTHHMSSWVPLAKPKAHVKNVPLPTVYWYSLIKLQMHESDRNYRY